MPSALLARRPHHGLGLNVLPGEHRTPIRGYAKLSLFGIFTGSGPWSHHRVVLLPEHSATLEDPEEQTAPPGLREPLPCPWPRSESTEGSVPSSLALHKLEGIPRSGYIFPNSLTSKNVSRNIVLVPFLLLCFRVLLYVFSTAFLVRTYWAPHTNAFISFLCFMSFYYSYRLPMWGGVLIMVIALRVLAHARKNTEESLVHCPFRCQDILLWDLISNAGDFAFSPLHNWQ